MESSYLHSLLVCVAIIPLVRGQCTECKPGTEYCDYHQANGLGRCESCLKLCFPGQGNEGVCQLKCPDFKISGADVMVDPGKAAFQMSRSNAEAVSTLNISLTAMASKAVQESSSSSDAHISHLPWALALTIACVLLLALLAIFLRRGRRCRNRQISGNDEEAQQNEPIIAELEQADNHSGERYTGREPPGHPTGEVSDLHPVRKDQPLLKNARPANEIAPSGRPYNTQRQSLPPQ